jgi:uncharacterized membrane protein YGL010W
MHSSLQDRRARSFVTLLTSYASYHQDPRNRSTHFVGVPLITFSLMIALALPSLTMHGTRVGLDRIATAALAIFYLYLDLPLGFALTVTLVLFAAGAESMTRLGTTLAAASAITCFIVGWCLQLLGHRLEGNRPALVDNVRQIFIAPIYLMAELAFTLGLRRDLQAQILRRMTAPAGAH